MKLLPHISSPGDLRKLPVAQLPALAEELREFIIDVVSVKEGHLGASLGVVELTIALHYVFNTPDDRLVWDVGHQAYGHKILTERREQFESIRQKDGLSGFPNREESPFDPFGTGHSSTSVSALLGMALAAGLKGNGSRQHIAVIGDASIASGMAFEALNHAGVSDANLLVILNDNAIGIDPSVGALKEYLTAVKKGEGGGENLFECLNLRYSGPMDGHDLPGLLEELTRQKSETGPRLLHLITTKGKGLQKAEENQVVYHAPGRFDKTTGDLLRTTKSPDLGPKYQDVFGHTLVELARKNLNIVGITPAMPTGSSLKYMMETLPERTFDVGIAEQHAVTLAAGMAAEGIVPYCAIYSTFLQRGYDQVIHDVALQNLPVVFCLDRAGLVGKDGATHHGVFDIAYLRCIPNLSLAAPMDNVELRNMLYTVQLENLGPVAIRYPRGHSHNPDWEQPFTKITWGTGRTLRKGTSVAVLSLGTLGRTVAGAIEESKSPEGFGHYDFRFAKPLDTVLLEEISANYTHLVTVEDGCLPGGFGSAVLEYLADRGLSIPVTRLGIGDAFVSHGTPEELYAEQGLDQTAILRVLNKCLDEV
ncbi:MAG: 1-deoxy-D-xylulose-5-phosphate synthase [Bacteroidetes bacterium]|nr:MAG: 1-deoxy-D-xylulose-5-phosphate synthase [Bacteroidota bacterium]UCE70460.1 MAG: 1-deoxy-D-xylulose-5-phosphate synthase [Flavobacteriaceae bacterium]